MVGDSVDLAVSVHPDILRWEAPTVEFAAAEGHPKVRPKAVARPEVAAAVAVAAMATPGKRGEGAPTKM